MAKVNVKKAAGVALKVATPILATVVLSRLAGGRLDVKGALLEAAEAAIRDVRAKRGGVPR